VKTLKSRAGFSLTELTVVAAIILIVSGLSLPSLSRVIDNVRVKSAAQQAAFLYQQARIRATQDDTYYNVVGNGPNSLCLDLNGNGVCDANDPSAALGGGAVLSNAGIPVQLDPTLLGFTPLNTESSATFTPQGNVVSSLAWNSRGLPCQKISSTSPCSNWLPSGGGAPVGWIQYVQLQRPSGNLYAAVVVNPAGKIKIWNYAPDGSGVSWH
jgi:prepilin-type N-terminal cleavage/methylation domain-containing protein